MYCKSRTYNLYLYAVCVLDWCAVCTGLVVLDWCCMYWTGEVQYGHPTSSDIGCTTRRTQIIWLSIAQHITHTVLIHLPSGYVHNMTALYYMSHDELTLLQALTSAPLSNITNTSAIWPFFDAMRSCSVKSILH